MRARGAGADARGARRPDAAALRRASGFSGLGGQPTWERLNHATPPSLFELLSAGKFVPEPNPCVLLLLHGGGARVGVRSH